jgi:hypothetical protein
MGAALRLVLVRVVLVEAVLLLAEALAVPAPALLPLALVALALAEALLLQAQARVVPGLALLAQVRVVVLAPPSAGGLAPAPQPEIPVVAATGSFAAQAAYGPSPAYRRSAEKASAKSSCSFPQRSAHIPLRAGEQAHAGPAKAVISNRQWVSPL